MVWHTLVFFFQSKCAKNPLKLLLLVATSIILFGCAGGPIKTATKFTTYEGFQPGPDGGVELVWARLGLREADRLKSKLDDYDSVVIDQIFVLAKYVINYWVDRLGDTLQNMDDA